MSTQPFTVLSIEPGIFNLGVLGSVCAQMLDRHVYDPAQNADEFADGALLLAKSDHENIEPEFLSLAETWKAERPSTSSMTAIVMHPAYQRIIGLGKPALPLILRELSKELDHWFWALKSISGEDPVPVEHRGRMKQMAQDWLQWGREKGYAR
jgi:hypothetical protein